LKGAKTLIVIAHRLSTLKNCDRIILLKDGMVKNVGSFSELCGREPDFARLVELTNVHPPQSD
jgi:ABC-type multidrug transport system fused ATPase/permease subunit